MSLLSKHLADASNEDVSAMILENAICSLRHGIEHYNDKAGGPTGAKYAIIHIAHAVELTLKGLVARNNRLLLIARVDTAGQVFTVDANECCKRLRKREIIKLSAEDEKRVTLLRDLRNDIEHFAPVQSEETMRKTAISLLGLCCAFMKDHADLELNDFLDQGHLKTVIDADRESQDIVKVAEAKLREFQSKGEAGEKSDLFLGACPFCGQDWLAHGLRVNVHKCLYCGYELKQGLCKHCGQNKIIEWVPAHNQWLCVLCKFKLNPIDPEQD